MKAAPTILIALLILSTPAASRPFDPNGTIAWKTEYVNEEYSNHASLAIDTQGKLHVAAWTIAGIRYYVKEDGAWIHKQHFGSGATPSLALDSNDRPHVAYYTRDGVAYWRWDGTQWLRENIGQSGEGGRVKLRFDSQDAPHLVYPDAGGTAEATLQHAWKSGGRWVIETVASDGSISFDARVGSDDRLHVAYRSPGGGDGSLRYGIRDASGVWSFETADPIGGGDAELALDSQNQPHIAYADEGEAMAHAHRTPSGWTITRLDNDQSAHMSIALDANDRPHIAYHQIFNRGWTNDPTQGHLRYARQLANGAWSVETADWIGFNGLNPSIAIDAKGQPHIAHTYSNHQVFPLDQARGWIRHTTPAIPAAISDAEALAASVLPPGILP